MIIHAGLLIKVLILCLVNFFTLTVLMWVGQSTVETNEQIEFDWKQNTFDFMPLFQYT